MFSKITTGSGGRSRSGKAAYIGNRNKNICSFFIRDTISSSSRKRGTFQSPFVTHLRSKMEFSKFKKESQNKNSFRRLESPSAERNKKLIWDVLSSKIFSKSRQLNPQYNSVDDDIYKVLEVAAGSGVHTSYFATQLQNLIATLPSSEASNSSPFIWYPSEPSEDGRESIVSYLHENDNDMNDYVAKPIDLLLDTSTERIKLPISSANDNAFCFVENARSIDLIISINMIHISPWGATIGLMKLANNMLCVNPQGYLFCYGPYKENGTAVQSNLNFDESLKSRNPDWGVRNVEDVIKAADKYGNLELVEKIEMPSNNLSLIFRHRRYCNTANMS